MPTTKGNRRGTTTRRSRREDEYLYGEGPAKAEQIRIERMAKRAGKHAALCKSYVLPTKVVVEKLLAAQKLLKEAAHELSRVPHSWRPERGTIGAVPIEEGARVKVKKAMRQKYVDVFDVDAELKVAEIIGSRILCEVRRGGQTMVIPMSRSHVQVV